MIPRVCDPRELRVLDTQLAQIEEVMTVLLAQQSPGGAGALGSLLPFLIIGLLFYFLLIRPQQKRARQQRDLVQSLGVGDLVVTVGGFHGTVRHVDESTVRLELAPGNTVTLSKQAVARRTIDADSGGADADSQELTGE